MRRRLFAVIGALAAVIAFLRFASVPVAGQSAATRAPVPAQAGAPLRTSWGDPDLQGIWHPDLQAPLQRDAKYAGREFLADEDVAAAGRAKALNFSRDNRAEPGSEQYVAGAYDAFWQFQRYTSQRTSLIVDPADGRIPPMASEGLKRRDAIRGYLNELMQGTSADKSVSARIKENPPYYNINRMNRADGPEDRALAERCMAPFAGYFLPQWDGFHRIVQSAGTVSIFYDVDQGQGYQRVVPISPAPHLPPQIRQWLGDARGHWEGNTLVVDTTNFTAKTDFFGSRENLHLVERWTRRDAKTIDYTVTIEDPTVWAKPWTVKLELNMQDATANRIYYEPRCHEGNYGLPDMLLGARTEERAFAAGKGPDPATKDTATDFGNEGGVDALQGIAGQP